MACGHWKVSKEAKFGRIRSSTDSKDNLQTLIWRIQKQIEKGSKDGTVSGEGMRKLSTTLRKLVPLANFTKGEASELAEEFIAWVETYGIKTPPTKSALEAFSTVPAAFMHNADEVRGASWESRQAMRVASDKSVREGHSSLPTLKNS